MSRTTAVWMEPTDGAILRTLAERGPEHGPVIAHRLGLSNDAFERRCRRLESRRVVERVTAEPLYRLTATGEEVVRTHVSPNVLAPPPGGDG